MAEFSYPLGMDLLKLVELLALMWLTLIASMIAPTAFLFVLFNILWIVCTIAVVCHLPIWK